MPDQVPTPDKPRESVDRVPIRTSGRSVIVERPPEKRWDLWRWYGERLSFRAGFFLPMVFMLLPIPVLFVRYPEWETVVKTLTLIGTTILALDVAIIEGYLLFDFEWYLIVAILLWVELWLLLWLVKNVEFLRLKWRRVDRFIVRREDKAIEVYTKYEFVRRFHFWGVVAFTFLPLNSGVFMGVFLGKVTGMPTRTLIGAVYLGLTLWIGIVMWAVALSVEFLRPFIPDFD